MRFEHQLATKQAPFSQTYQVVGLGIESPMTAPQTIDAGECVCLAPGTSLTLADSAGNAIIEVKSERRESQVTVDGNLVLEIAHCRPNQLIAITASSFSHSFVLLQPFGIYIQTDADSTNLARLTALLGDALHHYLPPTENPESEILSLRQKISRQSLLWLGLMAGLATAMSAAFLNRHGTSDVAGPAIETTQALGLQTDAETPKQLQASEPNRENLYPLASNLASPAKRDSNIQRRGASLQHAPSTSTAPTSPVADSTRTTAAASTGKRSNNKGATKKKVPAEASNNPLTPRQEAEIRDKLESYQLEAGFDPEGAARKLKQLRAELPHHAPIQKEIDRTLKSLPL